MFDLTSDLNSYLAPNERVLWQGQGKRRANMSTMGGYLFIVTFALFGLLMAGMFMALPFGSRSGRNSDPFFIIFPIALVAIGLGVGLPWVVLGRRAGNARYFVTNFSAIIVYAPTTGMGQRVTIVALRNLAQLTLSENRDGTGTLTLASNPYASRYSNSWMSDSPPAFANIEQPLQVYQLIRRQMAELNAG